MGDKHMRALPAGRTEKRLVKMAADAVRGDCPNPERIGCPSSDAVEAVVGRHLALPDFDNVVDHIATCAACFEEYGRRRLVRRLRNVGAVVVGCAALLILGLSWKYGPAKQPRPKEAVTKQAPAAVLTATLDYRNWTAERSGQSQPRPAVTPHLARAQLDITIDLPIGTEDTVYTVQFRSDNDKPVAEAVGSAAWNGTAEVLKIWTDLRNVPAGPYTVAIRSADSSVHLYPVILE
jgi:hypothetical protein